MIPSLPGNASGTLVDIARLPEIERIGLLSECLLIAILPGKALRTLVDIARFAEPFNMRLVNLIAKGVNLVF